MCTLPPNRSQRDAAELKEDGNGNERISRGCIWSTMKTYSVPVHQSRMESLQTNYLRPAISILQRYEVRSDYNSRFVTVSTVTNFASAHSLKSVNEPISEGIVPVKPLSRSLTASEEGIQAHCEAVRRSNMKKSQHKLT